MFFQLVQRHPGFIQKPIRQLVASCEKFVAGFRRDREALRNRQTDLGHFCQVGTLAAQEGAHVFVAFVE